MNFVDVAERMLSYDTQDLGEGVEEAEIVRVEKALNLQIVGSYREFLRRFGWGGVEHIELFGLGASAPEYLHLEKITMSERTEMAPPLKHSLLPLLNDGGGNLYCLDCGVVDSGENPVVFWSHDHIDGASHVPETIATSFSQWLSTELDELV